MRRPPPWFWLIPSVVAVLRMLPVISLRWAPPPAGQAFLGVSYLPKDFLAYASFVRQVPEAGSFFFYNAFTTDPQSPRFILLFHWLVGVGARLTGLSAIDALEWSRVPLLFLFFATLWWFLRPILPDAKDRLAASVLVGFAGGVESWLRLLARELPKPLEDRLLQDTWALHGWSVFASFYNPLWIAALTGAMLVLRPLLFSRDRSLPVLASTGAMFFVLFYIHPYTAVGVLAIVGMGPVLTLVFRERLDWRRNFANAAVLGAALAAIAGLTFWQMQDHVYRVSSGGVFGPQNMSVLWYPITLGVLGAMAAVGARRWIAARHPLRFALFGWIAAIAVLHWLPFLNGYKFVFLLPLPLCILAAPVAREVLAQPRRWLAAVAGIALFGGVVFQTVDAVRSTRDVSAVSSDVMQLLNALAAEPAGNALVPPGLGNVLPAFSPHRVWVGHWFLTPGFLARSEMFRRFVSTRSAAPRLREVLREQQIRYLVVPAARSKHVADELGEAVVEQLSFRELELLILR